jgi:endoglucanase
VLSKFKYGLVFILMIFMIITINADPGKIQKNIIIDQFGYRTNDIKIAVVSNPQLGFNSTENFIPGKTYEVRKWENDEVVFTDTIRAWYYGAIDYTSGDKGWWFDFSKVTEPGDYYIYDQQQKVGSYKFRISNDVYKDVMKAAMRVFYYQRLNDPKAKPFAEDPWIDEAAMIGPGQDKAALYVNDKENKTLAKDLSGGWMDAGDCNKYVTFAESPIQLLLTAYEQNPKAFTDDYNIPESGNGIPDVIDEVKYEIDWVKKMQDDDGGVFIKMGNIDWNSVCPLSLDKRPRYYGPKCSSSTIATSAMFAHAAIVFSKFPMLKDYAKDLERRALKAWKWYHSNPRSENCDTQEIKSGDADVSLNRQDEIEVVSAIYLFALTDDKKFNKVVKENFVVTAPFYDSYMSLYFGNVGDALLYYTSLGGADLRTKNVILSQRTKQGAGLDIFQFKERDDLYMAYMPKAVYTWGSNNPRMALGSANYDLITYKLDGGRKENFLKRALGMLHYMHGVNPLGIVYLSNMYNCGGDYCADAIWHDWFTKDSKWGNNPAPGYVTGGPNSEYAGGLDTLKLQPLQKAYKNWNNGFPENSWECTEPAIYYQASYVKLLSKFISE